jgi:hypothetical protein
LRKLCSGVSAERRISKFEQCGFLPKAATPTIVETKPANSVKKACERCGSFDVLEFAGKLLCAECVALAGSSCAGSSTEKGN